ncbi:MAG: hypothetical protein EPN55_07240 [Gammaproteobacteria bacterium]|nr:MAG: hypothetical protein EPN55_07240 [Gammaproteobacteria bacterium]
MVLRKIALTAMAIFLFSNIGLADEERWKRVNSIPTDAKKVNASMPIFGQRLVHGLPPGWKPGFENASGGHYIMEYVPVGQTVQRWEEMITVQGFKGLAKNPKVSPEFMLRAMMAQHKKICNEKLIVQPLGVRKVDAHEAFAALIGCAGIPGDHRSGLKEGYGEIAYYIAIKGSQDMYMIHRAMRFKEGAPTPGIVAALTKEMEVVEPIKLCELDISQTECWERESP